MGLINPRILPLTIVVAVLVLGVRAGDLWSTLTTGAEPAAVQGAQAQTAEEGQGASAGDAVMRTAMADSAKGGAPGEGEPRGAGAQSAPVRAGEALTPEMIESLVQRRRDLERRERALDEREAFLVLTEKRVDDKLAELRQLKADMVDLLDELDAKRKAQIESLVKIYEAMKPKDAARILENLDPDVLLDVVENMRENKIAPILAEMNSEVAKDVTAALVRRRQLPETAEGG